jgi:hypothetical protein
MSPRACLDAVEERKIPFPCRESNPSSPQPAVVPTELSWLIESEVEIDVDDWRLIGVVTIIMYLNIHASVLSRVGYITRLITSRRSGYSGYL